MQLPDTHPAFGARYAIAAVTQQGSWVSQTSAAPRLTSAEGASKAIVNQSPGPRQLAASRLTYPAIDNLVKPDSVIKAVLAGARREKADVIAAVGQCLQAYSRGRFRSYHWCS